MYLCTNCGFQILDDLEVCPKCGSIKPAYLNNTPENNSIPNASIVTDDNVTVEDDNPTIYLDVNESEDNEIEKLYNCFSLIFNSSIILSLFLFI